jgi:hypothetical protein
VTTRRLPIVVKPTETRPIQRCLDSLHDKPPSPRGYAARSRPNPASLSSSAT